MFPREFWANQIQRAWQDRTIVWLAGVRRVGKTVLTRSLPSIQYYDCELPRIRRRFEDPESFLRDSRGERIVLDEVHRLMNPSELLKIAADHFPDVRILATGSSTLGASSKFRDTLAGRKRDLWLTPMVLADLTAFGKEDLRHRLLRGGLPPFFLSDSLPERDFQEWLDAFWAKDIQMLFRLERRASFLKFIELVVAQSGDIFEATRFAAPCEVSRTTISNYLNVLEATLVAHVIRPFSTHRPTEIVAAPKVYAFDTGFVCYLRGWDELREEDVGALWEHFVLNEMHAHLQTRTINYWRDKRGHEVDFVYLRRGEGSRPETIDCKWTAAGFNPRNVLAFRRQYPQGSNWVVSSDVKQPYSRRYRDVEFQFINLEGLVGQLATAPCHDQAG